MMMRATVSSHGKFLGHNLGVLGSNICGEQFHQNLLAGTSAHDPGLIWTGKNNLDRRCRCLYECQRISRDERGHLIQKSSQGYGLFCDGACSRQSSRPPRKIGKRRTNIRLHERLEGRRVFKHTTQNHGGGRRVSIEAAVLGKRADQFRPTALETLRCNLVRSKHS